MRRSARQLREDALEIWRAAVEAVRSDRLVRDNVRVEGGWLSVVDRQILLAEIDRLVVVGAGKAGAGMAEGLEQALGPRVLDEKQVSGWVNVPADCVRETSHITLHAARPAGVNEPTEEGVRGAERILELVRGCGQRDVCLCLISGGGSALLPAPATGVSLADKQAVTQHLSGAGANIQELNTVRKQLSRIKGGGLARACSAGQLIVLIISDVIGDPLDAIASGPTVVDHSTPRDALQVLAKYSAQQSAAPDSVFAFLEAKAAAAPADSPDPPANVFNFVIGNNAVAVDAAGVEAERRGYSHAMNAARQLEGEAEHVGCHLADMAQRMRTQPGPDCLITGGEPIVKLVDSSRRGKGGRNQQLALAALVHLLEREQPDRGGNPLDGIALLSGGTDGEDGPTGAAGALVDAQLVEAMRNQGLSPQDFLARNDAYRFFEPLGGLVKTGPTHTNVCDVRVVVVDQNDTEADAGV